MFIQRDSIFFKREDGVFPFLVARFGGAGAATGRDDLGLYHRFSNALRSVETRH